MVATFSTQNHGAHRGFRAPEVGKGTELLGRAGDERTDSQSLEGFLYLHKVCLKPVMFVSSRTASLGGRQFQEGSRL